jgi:hypothetical protein
MKKWIITMDSSEKEAFIYICLWVNLFVIIYS